MRSHNIMCAAILAVLALCFALELWRASLSSPRHVFPFGASKPCSSKTFLCIWWRNEVASRNVGYWPWPACTTVNMKNATFDRMTCRPRTPRS